MSISNRLRELREESELTLEEVGNRIGTSKQTMYKYENNIITNIPFDKIEALANVYKTTPAYIMGWDNIPLLHEAASERVPYEQWLASGAKTKDLLTPTERKLLDSYTQLKESDDPKDRAAADAIERLLGLSEQGNDETD